MRREVLQPDSFLKTNVLLVNVVRPHCLSYWRCFIASLVIGKGYFITTTAKLQTLPTMTHEERARITTNIYFLINKLSFETFLPHSKHVGSPRCLMEGQNGRSGLNHLPTTFPGNSTIVINHGMWENRRYLLEM